MMCTDPKMQDAFMWISKTGVRSHVARLYLLDTQFAS